MKTHDVVIVGGGLAGASLALALKPLGLSVALIESQTREAKLTSPAGDRALALALGSVEIFRELDVWPRAQAKATPIRRIHVSEAGHFGKTHLDAEELAVPALGYVIPARDLEQAMMDACARQAIEVICPAAVTGLQIWRSWARVRFLKKEEEHCCLARLVVAADGGHSKVRQWMGVGQQVRDYGQMALVGTVESEKPNQYTAYERFTTSGPLALLPVGKYRSALIWTQEKRQAQTMRTWTNTQMETHLQRVFGWKLGRLRLVPPIRRFPLRLIRAERLFAERVALVGNAAHQLHPVAGQGFNLGLRDVMVLAQLIRRQVQNQGDVGAFTLLEKYGRARAKDHNRVIGFSDGLIQGFSLTTAIPVMGRNLGMLVLDHLPVLKRWFAYQAMGLHSPYDSINQGHGYQ